VELDGRGVRLSPNLVHTTEDAKRIYSSVRQCGGHALMQEWLPGARDAVTLFNANGEFWARMAQRSHREWPVLGGVSVLCETIPLLPDITSASERLVRGMDLEGCSMVEFRRDRDGRAVLMEVNPRMGGSLALAIAAGVNFPRLLYDWGVGGNLSPTTEYQVGKRLRWLAGDVWNLKCTFEMQGHPDIPTPLKATATFLRDFTRSGNTLDVIELGDLQPAFAEFNKLLLRHGAHRVRRVFSSVHSFAHVGKG
jgi:predicted ATP-grasp superfamily ATP-dependent carboligase